jgi:hypothetical protein
MDVETIEELGIFLEQNGYAVFCFPDIETGEKFWVVKGETTVAKATTLLEALQQAASTPAESPAVS